MFGVTAHGSWYSHLLVVRHWILHISWAKSSGSILFPRIVFVFMFLKLLFNDRIQGLVVFLYNHELFIWFDLLLGHCVHYLGSFMISTSRPWIWTFHQLIINGRLLQCLYIYGLSWLRSILLLIHHMNHTLAFLIQHWFYKPLSWTLTANGVAQSVDI